MNQFENLSKPSVPVHNKPLEDGSNSAIYRDDIYSLQTIPVKNDEIEKLGLGKRQKKLFLDRAGIHGPESVGPRNSYELGPGGTWMNRSVDPWDRAKAVQEASEKIKNLNENGASVEWIGTKIQKTPGIMREAGFVFHHDLKIENFGLEKDIIRKDLKQFFRNYIVEGLVVRHPR